VSALYRISARGGERSGDLATIFQLTGDTPEVRMRRAITRLRQLMMVASDDQAGLVRVAVTTGSPELSQQIANQLLRVLDSLNLSIRQAQALAESRFVEARLAEQGRELRQAEDRLQSFLVSNRQFETDPRLKSEYDRLTRALQISQGLYVSLAQGYQQLRIDASRTTPTLTVMERPLLPLDRLPRQLPLYAVVGLVIGGAGAIVGITLGAYLERVKGENRHRYAEFARERDAMIRPIRRLLRRN
jgi:uncharacterized protein involved in exopolysaccharide biosynthesis